MCLQQRIQIFIKALRELKNTKLKVPELVRGQFGRGSVTFSCMYSTD
jgi:hypothetical protein